MTLEEAIMNLAESNIDENNDWYSWREINEEKLPNGIELPQGNQYVKNIALKKALHEKWENTINHEEKKLIIKYYISTWGVIYRNSSNTIERYSRSSLHYNEITEQIISEGLRTNEQHPPQP